MHTTVKFAKVRPTAIIPTKREEDAGYDIYANFDEDYIRINPHETKMIPTGIASACDTDYCFILKVTLESSVNLKSNLLLIVLLINVILELKWKILKTWLEI